MGLFYIGTSGKATLVRGHLNGGLIEVREGAMQRTGGKAFQAEETAGAKVLM